MGIMTELLRMIVAGVVGFVILLLMPIYYLVLLALGAVSALSLLVAVFCGIGYALKPTTHNLVNALGFLSYSAAAFLIIFAIYYIPSRLKDRSTMRQQQRQALARIGGLRLASDEPFNERV